MASLEAPLFLRVYLFSKTLVNFRKRCVARLTNKKVIHVQFKRTQDEYRNTVLIALGLAELWTRLDQL